MMNKKRKLKIAIVGGMLGLLLTVYVPSRECAEAQTGNLFAVQIDPPIRPPN